MSAPIAEHVASETDTGERQSRGGAGVLPVTMPATTDNMHDHLSDCRDLTKLLIHATDALPGNYRTSFQMGLLQLTDRLERALEVLAADDRAKGLDV